MKIDEMPWESDRGDHWEYVTNMHGLIYMARSVKEGANLSGHCVPVGTVILYGGNETKILDALTAECLAIEYLNEHVTPEVSMK